MKNILVLCTGNSCRSQMAHGYLSLFVKGNAKIYTVGIQTHGLNKNAVSIMNEDGVDISNHTSNNVSEYDAINFDIILTVCDHAHENCPFIPSKNAIRIHQNFTDPSKIIGTKKEIESVFLKTRDEIKVYSKNLIESYI